MDHVRLLCDLGELTAALRSSASIAEYLDKTVAMVAQHMNADVCSVYLYEEEDRSLILRATRGLNREGVGTVRLGLGQGLVGLALKEMRPIREERGSAHPSYRFFEGLREEEFDSFLAVPVLRGIERLGALVLQRDVKRPFSSQDVTAMQAAANQLATAIDYARLVLTDQSGKAIAPGVEDEGYRGLYKGTSASVGIGLGPATVWERRRDLATAAGAMSAGRVEPRDLREAIDRTRAELEGLQDRVGERLSDVASLLFAVQMLMLKDANFAGRMEQLVDKGVHPAQAVLQVAQSYVAMFSKHHTAAIREKVDEVRDLASRILYNLRPGGAPRLSAAGEIVIARELLPSDMLVLGAEDAAGVVLVGGGATSHVAILARSLGLPLVIADHAELSGVAEGTPVLLDAEAGNVYVDPTEEIRTTFSRQQEARLQHDKGSRSLGPVTTADGTGVALLANINLLSDVKLTRELGLAGVGLYRTEFPFLVRSTFPTEEEQYVIYRRLVEDMDGSMVTFRTLDVGGDKVLAYFGDHREPNPFLGMRSIRFTLGHRTVFEDQVRAILRAGTDATIRIMFPMISSVEEFDEARLVVKNGAEQLGLPLPPIGMMVELPAAVEVADELAARADFFSIGTNDLVQYLLAADRTNEKVAYLYQTHHPAVLRAVARVVRAARKARLDVSVCGDMAHQTPMLEFLLGVGVRSLSVDPVHALRVGESIASVRLSEARETTERLLSCASSTETARVLGE